MGDGARVTRGLARSIATFLLLCFSMITGVEEEKKSGLDGTEGKKTARLV